MTELKQGTTTSQQTLDVIRGSCETQNGINETTDKITDIGRTVVTMMRELKTTEQHSRRGLPKTYSSVAGGNGLVISIHSPRNHKAPPSQALREIIVNIRNPLRVANLRAMSPRDLKERVGRAIEQRGNEHFRNIKPVSTNFYIGRHDEGNMQETLGSSRRRRPVGCNTVWEESKSS